MSCATEHNNTTRTKTMNHQNQQSALAGLTAAVLIVTLIPVEGIYAQKPQPPDALIEAAKYLERGEQEMNCSTERAERWVREAQNRLSGFRSSAPTERDAAAVLRAQAAFARDKVSECKRAIEQA